MANKFIRLSKCLANNFVINFAQKPCSGLDGFSAYTCTYIYVEVYSQHYK